MTFRANSITRRDSIVLGTLASLGGFASIQPRSAAAGTSPAAKTTSTQTGFASAKRCILVWLDGGPSHLETFDPKPLAAREVRGPLGTIATRTPGIAFSEGLPCLAQRSHSFSIIRSMTSPVGEHNLATNYALSGHIPGGRAAAPAFLLPVSSVIPMKQPYPVHIAVPNFSLGGGSKLTGFMSSDHLPWSLGSQPSDADFVSNLFRSSSATSPSRLGRRGRLLDDSQYADPQLKGAIDLLSNRTAQAAFDLSQESPQTLRRYGNKPIGKNCLLARRLLEAGVGLVTVNNKGWDTHDRLHERLHAGYTGAKVPVGLVPSLDLAVSALLDDLSANGMLDDTLVIVMGEFGRTPKINALGGRDHWPRAFSVLLAGGGVQPGAVYGSSDAVGENAADNPVSPADLVATLYHLLGIQPHQRIDTPDGQSMTRVPEEAQVVSELLV